MTTGSFFTNWVGIIFWFLFAMSVGFKYRYFLNNNDIKINEKKNCFGYGICGQDGAYLAELLLKKIIK